MPTWELIGYSTEDHGERAVRYRAYTTSERKAKAFDEVPRIQFTDSGHGIVFGARMLEPGEGRKPLKSACREHVEQHLQGWRKGPTGRENDLLVAGRVLAAMVLDEHPAGMTLADIALTWGGATPEQYSAIKRVQGALAA